MDPASAIINISEMSEQKKNKKKTRSGKKLILCGILVW